MLVSVLDSAFVRARRRDVHPILADVARYGTWWPGVTSTGHADAVRLVLAPPTLAARLQGRTQALDVRVEKVRRDLGVNFSCHGTLEGAGEWYYLDEPTGTVVHYLLSGRVADRSWRRTLAEHRAAVRAGLRELKDRLEGDRTAGAEPGAALLAEQREAAAAFAAGVEAWERRQTRE